MADDRAEPREASWRSLFPWTEIFRGFQIALDLNKLLLAAAGLVVTALGWWLLALVFGAAYKDKPPQWGEGNTYRSRYGSSDPEGLKKAWRDYRAELDDWNLMHRAAGIGSSDARYEPVDLALTLDELKQVRDARDHYEKAQTDLKALLKKDPDNLTPEEQKRLEDLIKLAGQGNLLESLLVAEGMPGPRATYVAARLDHVKPSGLMAGWPWSEDRGPNPFLLTTGQAGPVWEKGHFWDWFAFEQAPVLVEPLVKFLRPIVYFFSPQADGYTRSYCLCVMVWTLAVWSLFGGAITRIAAVQIARNERIGMSEAVRFTMKRLVYYVTAPLFPLVFVLGLLIIMIIFGYFSMIPILGDIAVSGLFWWVMLGFGLLMAVALVGLVGWPLMSATISTEGTDSWEAVSRSYTYVFQKPWHYIWYGLVAICYGAVVVFFVGFMGSFMVYLSKWGVAQTFGIKKVDREPSFLFAYAPTSFGWRTLLLDGVQVDNEPMVQNGVLNQVAYNKYVGRDPSYKGTDQLSWWNKVGAGLVAIWVGLLFLLVLGFGYSFFWSTATIIYLLMRKNVDTAELDEVYLEEDDQEGAYGGPLAAPVPGPVPAPAPTPSAPLPKTTQLQMVEAPALKTHVAEATTPLGTTAATVTADKPEETPAPTPPPSSNGGPASP